MGTWKCSSCDSFNPDSVDDCLTCGAPRKGPVDVIDGTPREAIVTCPQCQGANAMGRTTCQWCGAPLPVGPGSDIGDATNPMVESPVHSTMRGSTLEGMPVVESSDIATIEDPPASAQFHNPRPLPSGASSGAGDPGVRRCFTCGISLTPDEWILVAGPRILCRACFHEEFGSRSEESDSAGGSPGGADSESAEGGGLAGRPAVDPARVRAGNIWLALGGALSLLGVVVSFLVGFVWGFTPVAGGIILMGVGLGLRLSAGQSSTGSAGAPSAGTGSPP